MKKSNVFEIPEPFTGDVEKDLKLTEHWKGDGDVIRKDAKDYRVETCIESEEPEEDPICFQEYLGMLRDVVKAVEGGESFDNIKVTYCKTDWNKLKKKVEEFENVHLPVRADKLNAVENAGLRGKGTIVLEDMMIKKQFTVLDILKRILAYYD